MKTAAAACLASAVAASVVSAYILPGRYIIRKAEERTATGRTAYMEGEARFSKDLLADPAPARLYFASPDRFRGEFTLKDGKLLVLFSRGAGHATGPASFNLEVLKPWIFLPALLFVSAAAPGEKPSGDLAATLESRGINTSAASYGRFFGRIVFILGDRPAGGQALAGEAWIDKEKFSLVRLVLPYVSGKAKTSHEILLSGFGKEDYSDYFPSAIEIRSADKVLLYIDVEDARLNPSLSDAIFEWTK